MGKIQRSLVGLGAVVVARVGHKSSNGHLHHSMVGDIGRSHFFDSAQQSSRVACSSFSSDAVQWLGGLRQFSLPPVRERGRGFFGRVRSSWSMYYTAPILTLRRLTQGLK